MTQATAVAPGRNVARPVANLGNTCFANAVLQALAHAPELCLAMECLPHSQTCPVAIENSAKMRASPSVSPTGGTGTRKSRRSADRNVDDNDNNALEFCALCALEQHMEQVHDATQPRDKPVAPEAFVKGFVNHVAPWMRIGIQEDSHEFLRLLIDAMQKSCLKARRNDADNEAAAVSAFAKSPGGSTTEPVDKEYSFSLFRGLVESNVTCQYCNSSSSTVDPIEDIGLEVTIAEDRSEIGMPPLLADVQMAFSGFARAEALDSNYKCEKCGKVGKATKQSRLKSVPPILTLHLKRFRYGDSRHGADVMLRRSGRSEVKSGSAKIEGHVRFERLFDLKPYLTQEMQDAYKSGVVCRLFAVVVHAGKNSNSGHYIAYVRNVEKDEWWKMDDARVNLVHVNEVLEAEAYMLFYRVVQHPVAEEIRKVHLNMMDRAKEEKVKEQETVLVVDEVVEAETATVQVPKSVIGVIKNKRKRRSFSSGEDWARSKTKLPPHMTNIIHKIQDLIASDVQLAPEFFRRLSDAASGDGHYGFNGVKTTNEVKSSMAVSPIVAGVSEGDIIDDAETIRCKLWELLHEIAVRYESGGLTWSLSGEVDSDPMLVPPITTSKDVHGNMASLKDAAALVSVVEPEDANLL